MTGRSWYCKVPAPLHAPCPACERQADQILDGLLCLHCRQFFPADGSPARPLRPVHLDAFVIDRLRHWADDLPSEVVHYEGIPLVPPVEYDLLALMVRGMRHVVPDEIQHPD